MSETGKQRKINTHNIGQRATDNIRSIVDQTDTGLFRSLTERDYGIDGVIEIFDKGAITGKFALVQCKGKEGEINPLSTDSDFISCPGVTSASLDYALQGNSIVILCYASSTDNSKFYFVNLKEALTKEIKNKVYKSKKSQERVTIRIPTVNNTLDNIEKLWKMIDDFYDK